MTVFINPPSWLPPRVAHRDVVPTRVRRPGSTTSGPRSDPRTAKFRMAAVRPRPRRWTQTRKPACYRPTSEEQQ